MTRIRNASKDTLFTRANNTLSIIASEISYINKSEHESYEDIRAYHAPSECYTLVSKQYHYLRQSVFEKYNMTEEQFDEAVRQRTSEKWIHFHSNLI